MKRAILLLVVANLLLLFCTSKAVCGQDDLKIWNEFVEAVKKGDITADKMQTYNNLPKDMLLQWVKTFKDGKLWEQIQEIPEVYKVDNRIHYIVTFANNKDRRSIFCHTFLIEGEKWYFQHLENIFIRMDKIGELPASKFPDVSEETKAWQREEIYWSEQVRLFNWLTKIKGKELAFKWVKVGIGNSEGYLLGAKAWVPFYPQEKAFILYLCWEQANLRGNKPPRDSYVVLEKLEDNEAIVRMKLMYFDLYKTTGHLKQQISFDDYKKLFETLWQDRAEKAGWKLDISYNGDECIFSFKKKT